MLWNEIVDAALLLPQGATFYRCALQVNPAHYAETYRGSATSFSEVEYTTQLIARAKELGIQVLAITDHNHVGSVEPIAEEGAGAGIVVFPGFEIRSKEGVHFLCIFPFGTATARLERYLGAMGIEDPRPSDSLSTMDCGQIPAYVAEQGGIVIAAHITGNGGMLKVLEGKPCIAAWRNKHLLGVQIPGRIEDLDHSHRQIVRNQNPDYKRKPAPTGGLALAVVNAKDVAHPADLADPFATCQIKMTSPSLEGLRQAFLDPESRIRNNREEPVHSEFDLIALCWEGGFLDGISLHLNDNLNVLIGGRGTGKSTIVESIRYVLGLEPLGDDAHRAHEGIVKQVLMSGTKVTLLVRSRLPSAAEYLIERTVPNQPIIRDASGQITRLSPADVLPGVEVFGQHEMSELTKSPAKLTRLLDRFLDRDDSHAERRANIRHELGRNSVEILGSMERQMRIEERLSALPRLEETARRYEQAGVEARLKEATLLVKEEKKLSQCGEKLDAFTKPVRQLKNLVPIDLSFATDAEVSELPGAEILTRARDLVADADRAVMTAVRELELVLDAAGTKLKGMRDEWQTHKSRIDRAYQQTLRELQKDKIDGGEFIKVRKAIEELNPLKKTYADGEGQLEALRKGRAQLIADWHDVVATEVRAIQRAAKKVNKRLESVVRVSVTPSGNREPLYAFLRERIGGQLKPAIEKLRVLEELSVTEFAAACREGTSQLTTSYGIGGAAAERLSDADEETLLALEEIELPHTTKIELNIAGEDQAPVWRALDELSTGQKATAILLLLLLESDAPLVIDQPEDDLDNRFITEGIVPKLREAKKRRQFVVTTHNANIPVLGDAELIVALVTDTADGESRVRVPSDYLGAIDAHSVRGMVELVLEGGKEAFEARRRKYGF